MADLAADDQCAARVPRALHTDVIAVLPRGYFPQNGSALADKPGVTFCREFDTCQKVGYNRCPGWILSLGKPGNLLGRSGCTYCDL